MFYSESILYKNWCTYVCMYRLMFLTYSKTAGPILRTFSVIFRLTHRVILSFWYMVINKIIVTIWSRGRSLAVYIFQSFYEISSRNAINIIIKFTLIFFNYHEFRVFYKAQPHAMSVRVLQLHMGLVVRKNLDDMGTSAKVSNWTVAVMQFCELYVTNIFAI